MALWLWYIKLISITVCSIRYKIMTGTEPLNKDSSPPHHEAQTVKLKMEDKMVQLQKKVIKKAHY